MLLVVRPWSYCIIFACFFLAVEFAFHFMLVDTSCCFLSCSWSFCAGVYCHVCNHIATLNTGYL
jgi:hypothetical protein